MIFKNFQQTVTLFSDSAFPLPFPKGEGSGVGFRYSNNYKKYQNWLVANPTPSPSPLRKGRGGSLESIDEQI